MSATNQYIDVLRRLNTGELDTLRRLGGRGLDESADGFDLFAGLWWPLRERSERAPRRAVAWLVAKLYAHSPIPHLPDYYLARQLGRCQPNQDLARQRYQQRFDRLLVLPLPLIEPDLRWSVSWVSSNDPKLDWVRLTDDLSIWERESTRLKWAKQFLQAYEREESC